MERKWLEKQFEKMGGRITIRKGTSPNGGILRMNVAVDRQGEHFTLTIHPDVDEKDIIIQCLDFDPKLKQMLLHIRTPKVTTIVDRVGKRLVERTEVTSPLSRNPNDFHNEKLLVGRDEMHWFVAGVTVAKNIREAFSLLRPNAVTVAMNRSGVKSKDWRKRKNKGFIRQGEWFFVPVHFTEDKNTIIHKDEPIMRGGGGKPHYVEEIVRFGGEIVYTRGSQILNESTWKKLPREEQAFYRQQVSNARVLVRGKVKHPDHHTVNLVGWHEIHLSNEFQNGNRGRTIFNGFID